jgi:hypothetical protein
MLCAGSPGIIDLSTPFQMKRFLLLLLPVATIAFIVHDHANSCRVAHHPGAGSFPVCE